jgi:MoxR-like ATPase
MTIEEVRTLRQEVARVQVESTILEYCLDLVRATRTSGDGVVGVSVRGGLQLVAAVRGLAFLRGRDYAVPEDVRDLAVPILAHRLSRLDGEWDMLQRRKALEDVVQRILPPR